MRSGLLITWLLPLIAGCSGWMDYPAGDGPSPERRVAELTDENRQLHGQIDQLKTDNMILKARLTELRERETALSERLHKLKFMLDHQEVQSADLAQAAVERDRYKAYAKILQSRIDSLNRQIEDLRALVSSLSDGRGDQATPPAAQAPLDTARSGE